MLVTAVLDLYNQGLALYKKREWDLAKAKFAEVLSVTPDDGPSRLYLRRCNHFKTSPPPDNWDGVFTMTNK